VSSDKTSSVLVQVEQKFKAANEKEKKKGTQFQEALLIFYISNRRRFGPSCSMKVKQERRKEKSPISKQL